MSNSNILELSLSQIRTVVNSSEKDNPELNISILRNCTIEQISMFYEYLSLQLGYNLRLDIGTYDNILQDLSNSENHDKFKNADCIVIFLEIRILSPRLFYSFNTLSEHEIKKEQQNVEDYIQQTLLSIKSVSDAVVIYHGFLYPSYFVHGILDHSYENVQIRLIENLNKYAQNLLKDIGNGYFINVNLVKSRIGDEKFFDNRYWYISKLPYSIESLREIASEDFKIIRALKGKSKKCIIVDCDNTLWGGVVGEDGTHGIKLGMDYPGVCYRDFQSTILSYYNAGVTISLCSKNNEDDVWDVFEKNSNMVLKRDHISSYQINWDDKVTNIKRISSELNISLEHITFIDDSEFEINLVKQSLPQVQCIQLPFKKPSDYRQILSRNSLFDSLSYTNEDRVRNVFYKNQKKRDSLKVDLNNDVSKFLESLELTTKITRSDLADVNRISQLTLRTNQFNLRTQRYSESEIKEFICSDVYDIYQISASDKFGEYGVIGACIIKIDKESCFIDTFLMSCRAIGRGIETIFLSYIIDKINEKNVFTIYAEFISSEKNVQVKDFYLQHNFRNYIKKKNYFIFNKKSKKIVIPSHITCHQN